MFKRLLTALLCALMAVPVCAEEAAPAAPVNTPGRESCGQPNCFWETPMDFRDEETMWAMLTSPMTVVSGNFRAQAEVYAEPSEDSKVIADVTRSTQGVHVLETLDNGWTKIECYSSSFSGSPTKAYNVLTTGYIQTELLVKAEVRTEFALVVDKLTQRLYIYQDGKLFDELLVSTGLPTKKDPENETRSGEYLLYSPTGGFWSGELLCNYGIRYNDGDLIHEVPHIPRESGAYYGRTEPLLGQRASHGCIRVQRKRTEKGVNMRWIWNNMKDKMNTRLIIWEDWQGRQIPVPAAETPLYYNDKGGKDYHDSPTCYGVSDKFEPMTAFTYGELESDTYKKLKVCIYCNPPLRETVLAEINAAHAPAEEAPVGTPHWRTLIEKKK
jgi:lipoprotein-anchoring transpeptidase ErfK/SrfK